MSDTDQMLQQYAAAFGIDAFHDHQLHAFHEVPQQQPKPERACFYYPTGKGKTITALVTLKMLGHNTALVIAPPITQPDWELDAAKLGIQLRVMSHAKFRMKDTKLVRTQPIVVDEFHMLGGRKSVGWKKLDRISPNLQAPIIILSATPQYNDAERVYCIQHILDPASLRGGYEKWMLDNCVLEPSFKGLPTVVGFRNFASAEEYLKHLPGVYHLPDTAQYQFIDKTFHINVPAEWEDLGWDRRKDSLMASIIERRISHTRFQLLDDDGLLRGPVLGWVLGVHSLDDKPSLVYCDHANVAQATVESLAQAGIQGVLVTGKTSDYLKAKALHSFRRGDIPVLVGTSTLVTGTDGLDKVCDTLIIVQDTQDDALRRQLVGRILPRGASTNYAAKKFHRAVVLSP